MGGSSSKESNRANDIARQERERASQQASALRAQQEAAAAQLMREVQAVTAPTALESDRTSRLQTLEPEVQQLLMSIARGGEAVPTELGRALQARLLSDLNRNPDDVFAPNLQLLKGEVGNFAARRGITGSGLELEQLGRTGVDLAIKQAQAREQLRQQQVQQAITGQQSLEQIGSQRRGEISNYLRNLQALEDARRGRQVSAVSGAASGGADIRSSGNLAALNRLSTGEERALGIESAQLAADRQARASQQEGIGRMIGTGLGAAASIGAAPFTGGASLMALPGVLQGGFGGGGGGSSIPFIPFPMGQPSVPSAGQLRASQRSAPFRGGGAWDDFASNGYRF